MDKQAIRQIVPIQMGSRPAMYFVIIERTLIPAEATDAEAEPWSVLSKLFLPFPPYEQLELKWKGLTLPIQKITWHCEFGFFIAYTGYEILASHVQPEGRAKVYLTQGTWEFAVSGVETTARCEEIFKEAVQKINTSSQILVPRGPLGG